jgi:hypothetical protein
MSENDSESKNAIVMTPVTSSRLSAVGFDAESGTCRVEFKSGGTYEYMGVTESDAQELINSPSPGREFETFKRKYTGEKI